MISVLTNQETASLKKNLGIINNKLTIIFALLIIKKSHECIIK